MIPKNIDEKTLDTTKKWNLKYYMNNNFKAF
jgi:hypothetical protein